MRRALDLGRKASAIYPNHVLRRNNVALFAMYLGEFETAEKQAAGVLQLNKEFAKAYLAIALSELGTGRPAEAESTWQTLRAVSRRRSRFRGAWPRRSRHIRGSACRRVPHSRRGACRAAADSVHEHHRQADRDLGRGPPTTGAQRGRVEACGGGSRQESRPGHCAARRPCARARGQAGACA